MKKSDKGPKPCRLFLLLLLLGCALATSCRSNEGHRAANVGARSNAVREFKGEYFEGRGVGWNRTLNIHADGTFEFTGVGCVGPVETNCGKVSFINNVLHLKTKKSNVISFVQGTPADFYPVRWGARLYLVPTNKVPIFCDDINLGFEPRNKMYGFYYLRKSDCDQPTSGKPSLPGEWSKYVLDRPVSGKVSELVSKQEAWIDVGSELGLMVGMELRVHTFGFSGSGTAHVKAVEPGRCLIERAATSPGCRLTVGQRVTSRFDE